MILSTSIIPALGRYQSTAYLYITPGLPYVDNLTLYNMSSLKDRRIEQCNELFELVASDLARELHHLLPAKNVSRYNLRNQREFTQHKMRTKRLSNRCLSGRTLARSFIKTFYGDRL